MNKTYIEDRFGVLAKTANGSTVNSGFLRVTNDTVHNEIANLEFTGHTFGLFGQGKAVMPADGIAYSYNYTFLGANTAGMMISLFPYDPTQTGLLPTKTITIEASAVQWRNNFVSLADPPTPQTSIPAMAGRASVLALGGMFSIGLIIS